MAQGSLPLSRFMPKPEEHSENNITRAKAGIILATLFFLGLILFGELAPLGDFLPVNGITREGVEKYRIHVLSTPGLDKVLSKETSLNVTARIDGFKADKNLFRLDGGYDFFAYSRLNAEWDFEDAEPKPGAKGIHYSVVKKAKGEKDGKSKNEWVLKKNDIEVGTIDGASSESFDAEKPPSVTPLFNGKFLLLTSGDEPVRTKSVIKDPDDPALTPLHFGGEVENIYTDREGAKIFAKVKESEGTGINTSTFSYALRYVDLDSQIEPKSFDIPLTKAAKVCYNAKANAIAVLDPEKLRILDAGSGRPREIIYPEKLFKKKRKELPLDMVSLTGVPALLLNDTLIDLRDGSIVDSLPGFTAKSLYVVDFKNKTLYYSPMDKDGENTMNIAIYDLHNLSLEKQIQLGTKNSLEAERKERQDNLRYLFIDSKGFLIALSAPESS